jgi:hypothetical protein
VLDNVEYRSSVGQPPYRLRVEAAIDRTEWQWLDRLANVCVICTCIVVSLTLVQRWLIPKDGGGKAPMPSSNEKLTSRRSTNAPR